MRRWGSRGQNEAYPPSPFPTCIARSETRRALRLMRRHGQHSPIAEDVGDGTRRSFGDETCEIFGSNPNDVHDADVREHARIGPFVDGGGADAEELSDLTDREELLDRR